MEMSSGRFSGLNIGHQKPLSDQERELQSEIFDKFGARGDIIRIWRNNVGVAYGITQVKLMIDYLLQGKLHSAIAISKKLIPVRFGVTGSADILGIIKPDGRMLAIECKSSKGVASKEQIAWRTMFEGFGGVYILAYSLDDVREGLLKAGVMV